MKVQNKYPSCIAITGGVSIFKFFPHKNHKENNCESKYLCS